MGHAGWIHKNDPGESQIRFPILCCFNQLRPHCRPRGGRSGKSDVDGSDPPFLLPGAGAGVLRNSHLRSTLWEGRSRPNYP